MKEQLGKFAKSLRQGQTIYKVYALGMSSYIQTAVVCSRHKKTGYGDFLAIDVKNVYHNGVYSNVMTESLSDMNALMGCNGYNLHRVFFSKKRAEKYLALCFNHNLDSVNDCFDDFYMDDSHNDDYDYDYGQYEYC